MPRAVVILKDQMTLKSRGPIYLKYTRNPIRYKGASTLRTE